MGKTENVLEPMIAKDIKKKRFLVEATKGLAFSLLSSKKAKLQGAYSNEFLNNNFNLSMIIPTTRKYRYF